MQAIDRGKLAQQCRDAVVHADVFAVCHRVLRNQNKLAHALIGKASGFGNQVVDGPASKLSAKSGNCAERAHMVAAFGDLQIRHVGRRGEDPRNRRNFF